MAFILPPARESGGALSQFFGGVSEGLGDDLPEALNKFFADKKNRREKTQLQEDLESLGNDATIIERKIRIQKAEIDDAEKKKLLELEDLKGIEALSSLTGEISEQDVLKNAPNMSIANLLMSLRGQQISEKRQTAADTRQAALDKAKIEADKVKAEKEIEKEAAALTKEQEKETAQLAKDKNTFLRGLGDDVQKVIGKDAWDLLSIDDRRKLINYGEQMFDQTGDPVEARRLTIDKALEEEPDFPEEEKDREIVPPYISVTQSALKGWNASISGRAAALASGEPLSEYEERTGLPKNASFLDRTVYNLSKLAADSPYYAAGATAGGIGGAALGGTITTPTVLGVPFGIMAGGSVGAGVGLLALPTMVETALTQYQQYLEKGGDATFGGFIDAVGQTLQAGVDAGVEGAMFATLARLKPLLSKYPSFRKLFSMKGLKGKAAENLVMSSLQSGGILGSRVISGQKVSREDAIDLFSIVFGANVLGGLSKKLSESFAKKIEQSGVEPQDFVENVKARMEFQNQNPNNPILLNRAINDVSNEYSKAKEVFEKTSKPEVGREQLEKGREEKKKLAERVREEPLEKILEPKKPTKKVKEAQKEVGKAEKEVERIEVKIEQQDKNIESLERNIEKAPEKEKKVRERGVELAKQEIKRLEEDLRTQKERVVTQQGVVESLKPVRPPPQTQFELAESIEKHNKQLVEISKDPMGALADSWKKMFAEDQKYQTRLAKEVRSGELPEPKRLDTYIRPLVPYLKAYKELLKNVQRQIKDLQNVKGADATKQRKDLRALEKNINTNIRINEAKQKLHKRKLYVKQLAQGKGNAYLKQLVKNLGTTAKEFQKDFIKARELLDPSEAKIAKVGKETLSKSVENVSKEPTKQNVETLSEQTGLSKEQITEARQEGQDLAEKAKESIEKGESFEKFWKKAKDIIEKYKEENIPKIKKATLNAIIFGGLQYALEKAFGYKAPVTLLTMFSPGDLKAKFGVTAIVNAYRFLYRRGEEVYWRRQLKQARSIREKTQLVNNLKKKGWSTARLKELRK